MPRPDPLYSRPAPPRRGGSAAGFDTHLAAEGVHEAALDRRVAVELVHLRVEVCEGHQPAPRLVGGGPGGPGGLQW